MLNNKIKDIKDFYKQYNATAYDYSADLTIIEYFKKQVEKTPEAIAVTFRDTSLTYRELDEQSNQVANILLEKGATNNAFIGISLYRSLEMIVGIYGILKSGCAYLPISPDTPKERLEYLVEDSGILLMLTHGQLPKAFDLLTIETIDLHASTLNRYSKHLNYNDYKSCDVMYLIYTSGSTGKPKGVMVENYTVVNRLMWMQKAYRIDHSDTIIQKTPFVFDVSVWELFWWAIVGAKLCMLEPGHEKFPKAMIKEIERSHITTMHFVPSMLSMFLNYLEESNNIATLKSLKKVFCSGEKLLSSYVNKFNHLFSQDKDIKLINLYGPTEATVDVTHYLCPRDTNINIVPIGKPIDNVRLYVVKDGKLQAPGEEGELLIAGRCLARGYLNRDALTNERFVACDTATGERVYHSGDMVKILDDGNIAYINRLDFQVKVRGLRIELGEIENMAMTYHGVKQCTVLLKNHNTLNPIFVALLIVNQKIDTQDLKQFLKLKLPSYMVPAKYMILEEYPLTENGKLDRKKMMAMI